MRLSHALSEILRLVERRNKYYFIWKLCELVIKYTLLLTTTVSKFLITIHDSRSFIKPIISLIIIIIMMMMTEQSHRIAWL